MIYFDYTFFIVLSSTILVGISCGIIGSCIMLQRKSLFGDAIAHATLPGITFAFLYTGTKQPIHLFIGAIISSIIGSILINLIQDLSSLRKETAIGIILATSFGVGTLLLSFIQSNPNAQKAGINKFLLGNPATILKEELFIICFITLLIITTFILCWKEFKIVIFNPDFAYALGMHVTYINILLTLLTICSIIIGLQTVGVILMSALLIAPACAAYQWTQNLSSMILASCFFATIATTLGTIISSNFNHIPAGPVIVIIATLITFISLLFAPKTGIISSYIRKKNQQTYLNQYKTLQCFLLFNESKTDPFYAHDIQALRAIGKNISQKTLLSLQQQNLLCKTHDNFWQLTPKGLLIAQKEQKHL